MFVGIIRRISEGTTVKLGGFDKIFDSLALDRLNAICLEIPLISYDCATRLEVRARGLKDMQRERVRFYNFRFNSGLLALLESEVVILASLISIALRSRSRITVFSADSGSTFLIYLLRKIGLVKTWIQHIPDFTPPRDRYSNRVISELYRLSMLQIWRTCEFVTLPNERIFERLNKTLGDRNRSVFVFPNTPRILLPQETSRSALKVVCAPSTIERRFDLETAIRGLSELPRIELSILGAQTDEKYFDELKYLAKSLNLSERIFFHGLLDAHQAEREIRRAQFGLALYKKVDPSDQFLEFGDSLKIRQFAALGLVTLGSSWVFPVIEMKTYGACISLPKNSDWPREVARLSANEEAMSSISWQANKWTTRQEEIWNQSFYHLNAVVPR